MFFLTLEKNTFYDITISILRVIRYLDFIKTFLEKLTIID
ncbi:hypothetical protein BJQ96_03055 [Flavobacterium sp. PL0002]|nr:hypothetical protein [Flavobacterium sp. PL002]